METHALGTRDIGRSAIREELARLALPQFLDRGFDKVTFDVLAESAGVSRSTFLRYFPTKEDVVLFVFDAVGDDVVDALSVTADQVSEWAALRHCLEPAVQFLSRSEQQVPLMRLVWSTPALFLRLHQKQAGWRPRMAQQLVDRADSAPEGSSPVGSLALRTRVAAALECLTVAIDSWLEEDGSRELSDLLDQTFEAIRLIR